MAFGLGKPQGRRYTVDDGERFATLVRRFPDLIGGDQMAKNTGNGHRKGAVTGRYQTAGKGGWTKRTSTGKRMGTKASPWKGVRKK